MASFECGGNSAPVVQIVSASGASMPMFVTGTDPAIGGTVNQVVDMTAEAADYDPGFEFVILVESAAPIEVQLANGDNFTISTVHATAYLGDWIPEKLLKVYKTGTTGTFSVGR